jgi:hypothetical protein
MLLTFILFLSFYISSTDLEHSLGASESLRCDFKIPVAPICLYAYNDSRTTERIFMKFGIEEIYEELLSHLNFG